MIDFTELLRQIKFYAAALDSVILFGLGLSGAITLFVQWFKTTSFMEWLLTKVKLPQAWPKYLAVTVGTLFGSVYLIFGVEFGLPPDTFNVIIRIVAAGFWSFTSSIAYDLLKYTTAKGVAEHVYGVEEAATLNAGTPNPPELTYQEQK